MTLFSHIRVTTLFLCCVLLASNAQPRSGQPVKACTVLDAVERYNGKTVTISGQIFPSGWLLTSAGLCTRQLVVRFADEPDVSAKYRRPMVKNERYHAFLDAISRKRHIDCPPHSVCAMQDIAYYQFINVELRGRVSTEQDAFVGDDADSFGRTRFVVDEVISAEPGPPAQ